MKWTVLLLCCLFLLSCEMADRETEQQDKGTGVQTQTESVAVVNTEHTTSELYDQNDPLSESQTYDESLVKAESFEFPMEYLLEVHALLVEHMIDLQIVGVGISHTDNKVTIDVISEEHIAPIEELLNQEQIDSNCYDFCVSGPIVPCGLSS